MRLERGYVSSVVCLILLAILAIPVDASFRPSFDLDQCSWNATDIALVQTTPKDGVFSVVESWKGDLKPGDSMEVPELKPDENAMPVTSYPKSMGFGPEDKVGISERIPRQPLGSRMILFLKRPVEGGAASPAGSRAGMKWGPASVWGEIRVSAVWIDHAKAFCFRQLINPGPTVLSECWPWQVRSSDEAAITVRIQQVLQVQRNLAKTLAAKNPDDRAVGLGSIALGDVYEARKEALNALGKAGTVALPEILQVMDEPKVPYDGTELIRVFIEAAGKDRGRQLHARLQQDMIYWKNIGPTLTQKWLDQLVEPCLPLFVRFNETVLLIRELDREKYAPAAQTIAELRDFWVSQTQLYDPKWEFSKRGHTYITGLDQVHSEAFGLGEECDAFLRHVGIKKTDH